MAAVAPGFHEEAREGLGLYEFVEHAGPANPVQVGPVGEHLLGN